MNEITTVINSLLKSHKLFSTMMPCEINDGLCEEFAYAVKKQAPAAEPIWMDEYLKQDGFIDIEGVSIGHCFIMFQGRFYDSECPEGVDCLEELPFVTRQSASKIIRKYIDMVREI